MLKGIGIPIQLPQLSKSYRRQSVMSDILGPFLKKNQHLESLFWVHLKLKKELEMIVFYMLTVPILKILKKKKPNRPKFI